MAGLLLFTAGYSYGQMERYGYKRELKGITGQWHTLVLADDIFSKLSNGLADIRVFGITAAGDTIEAPYLLRLTDEKLLEKEVSFKAFNASHNDSGFYFSFEVPATEPINEMRLDFADPNFDWHVRLEGSQDQQRWFTVLSDYRILSIRNGQTDFQFTRLVFPESKYRFFRLSFNSREQPKLSAVNIIQRQTAQGRLREYSVSELGIKENRQRRQTEIDMSLPLAVPVSRLSIAVGDTFDYYRPVLIQRLVDSLKTTQGWRQNFVTIYSGTLHSLEKNEFVFGSTIAQRLKILINNQENQPLHVGDVQVKGYEHELMIRFTRPATYYLVYGNGRAAKPDYDINRFEENIPVAPGPLEAGAEQKILRSDAPAPGPIFGNKAWLWVVMAAVILTLGWFSVRMMRKG